MNSTKMPAWLWLRYHRDTLVGFAWMSGGVVVLAVVIAILLILRGPATLEEGTVTGFSFRESDTGSKRVMTIRLRDGQATIRVRSHLDCRIGDTVKVTRVRYLWGFGHGIRVGDAAPCTRPAAR